MARGRKAASLLLWLRRCFLRAHIGVVLVATASAVAAQEEELQIFGGEDIRKKEYPWFAVLRRVEDSQLVCSGALIGARHVVTAEHCIESVGSILVEIGYWCKNRGNCGRESDFVGVRDLHRHGGGGDFALLVLDRAVSFDVKPAVPYLGPSRHKSQRRLKKGRMMELVGAGREGGRGSEVSLFAKKLKVEYLKPKSCRRRLKDPSFVSQFDICSVPQNGNACSGDSGAALVVPGKVALKKRDVILAVHKFGQTLCADHDNPLVGHFRISEAADLIHRVVCKGDFPEDWCNPGGNGSGRRSPTAAPVVNSMDKVKDKDDEDSDKAKNPSPVGIKKVELLHTWTNHTDSVLSVAFNLDASKIVSGSCDRTIKLWNLPAATEDADALPVFTTFGNGHTRCVSSVRFSPVSDSLVVSGGRDHLALRWNAFTGQYTVGFGPNFNTVWSVRWSHDASRVLTISHDGSLREWDAFGGSMINIISGQELGLPGSAGPGFGLDSHPTNVAKVAASFNGMVVLRRSVASGNQTFFHWMAHPSTVIYSVAYSPDGDLLATASSDGSIRVWDNITVEDDQPVLLGEFLGHSGPVRAVAWSPKGQFLASGSEDGTVRLWNVAAAVENRETASTVPQTPFLTLQGHSELVTSVDWSADGGLLVSGSYDNSVRVWRVSGLVEE